MAFQVNVNDDILSGIPSTSNGNSAGNRVGGRSADKVLNISGGIFFGIGGGGGDGDGG